MTLVVARTGVLVLGWAEMLHPRVPAGQAGGGKFTSKSSGSKAKAKGGAGAKGAKGKTQSASAKAAAEAKIILPQFMSMNPQQRAAFLAKLTDPQLRALQAEASKGNSNDPAVRAALTAIKDQVAARSLTGAKGPTQINADKAAAASKKAATAKASADKKAASAAKAAAKPAAKPAAPKATPKPATKAAPKPAAPAKPAGSTTPATPTPASTRPRTRTRHTVTRRRTATPAAAPLKASHPHPLQLAFPPAPVLKTAADIRAAVQADAKVLPPMRPAYRRKVIAAAKTCGALRDIPTAWLKPSGTS